MGEIDGVVMDFFREFLCAQFVAWWMLLAGRYFMSIFKVVSFSMCSGRWLIYLSFCCWIILVGRSADAVQHTGRFQPAGDAVVQPRWAQSLCAQ